MSSSSVAEPSNSAHPVVRILAAPAGTTGPESTKITAELSPQDLFRAFCQVGFVTREAANEGFPGRTRFLAPLFVMRFSLLSGFRLGHRIIS
jgi:hypothetical protein